ncbi:hypothetical protein [Aurantimonas coralicida]|uniref:hypothetical protein n=1 Tax=Aurantimonas coralicida TaxID=182270 RepID=UPI001E34D82E|nr:hypothetical protein [Aurantimonas coralicida]MCD1645207.1 hypothetical protein [Aurantimonas coralicida]
MRSADTYRSSRRNAARDEARKLGQKLRDVFAPKLNGDGRVRTAHPGFGRASKYMPHQGAQEKARRARPIMSLPA